MPRNKWLLNSLVLTLGIGLGIAYGLWNLPSSGSREPKDSRFSKDRFLAEREASAFGNRNYDFFNSLNSPRIDYQAVLSELLSRDIDYYSVDLPKLYLLFEMWGYTSPRQALEAIDDIPVRLRKRVRSHLFEGWARRNPEEIARYYVENRENLYQTDTLSTAVGCWSESNPEEALKFLSSLDKSEERKGLEAILSSVQSAHPEKFARIISLIPEHAWDDSSFLKKTMQQWSMEDPVSALEWMASLPGDKRELLPDYRGVESLPPLNSLPEQSIETPDALPSLVEKYPRWLQPSAWGLILTDMANREGWIAMTRWKQAHVPDDLTAKIHESNSFRAYFPPEGDDRRLYEDLLREFPETKIPEDFTVNVYDEYRNKFSARNPREYLAFKKEVQHEEADINASRTLAHWMYDEPDSAREWWEKRSQNISDERKKRVFGMIDFDKPIMAIKKP